MRFGRNFESLSNTIYLRHTQFWSSQPALLYGLSILIGSGSFLFLDFPWNWGWPLLFSIYLAVQRQFMPILLIGASAFYSWMLYGPEVKGNSGYFSIHSLQPHHSPFNKGLVYKGKLYIEGQKISCSVYHPFKQNHPPANCDYILHGELKQRGPYNYLFRAKEWVPVTGTHSLAELRFQMKERFRHFLERKLKRERVAPFLGSLITGDVEDRSLRYEFGRIGLQHILAISGFHFAILIAFFSYFLHFFIQGRLKYLLLLLAISTYFLFVGTVPAVQRSWLTALFYLVGKLIGRQSSGLNLLGAALLTEVVLDPLVSQQIGFQLSFLSCAGILLFQPLFKPWVYHLFPEHEPENLNRTAQHGYLLTSFLRQGLSLTLSVNAAIFPLILYHFHSFPLLSLFYNLFFPFLVSCVLFSLLIALTLYTLFPPLSGALFAITDFFTAQLLDLAAYPPLALDYSIRVYSFPAWVIPFYLSALFCLSLKGRRAFLLTNTPNFE